MEGGREAVRRREVPLFSLGLDEQDKTRQFYLLTSAPPPCGCVSALFFGPAIRYRPRTRFRIRTVNETKRATGRDHNRTILIER